MAATVMTLGLWQGHSSIENFFFYSDRYVVREVKVRISTKKDGGRTDRIV